MRLFTNCRSCRKETYVRSNSTTRPDLIKDKGETFSIKCSKCTVTNDVHVNDVKARESTGIILGVVILSFVITALLWSILGAIGTISITIPILIWKAQSNSVRAFNRYMIDRN